MRSTADHYAIAANDATDAAEAAGVAYNLAVDASLAARAHFIAVNTLDANLADIAAHVAADKARRRSKAALARVEILIEAFKVNEGTSHALH
jgi:hypothetical protein